MPPRPPRSAHALTTTHFFFLPQPATRRNPPPTAAQGATPEEEKWALLDDARTAWAMQQRSLIDAIGNEAESAIAAASAGAGAGADAVETDGDGSVGDGTPRRLDMEPFSDSSFGFAQPRASGSELSMTTSLSGPDVLLVTVQVGLGGAKGARVAVGRRGWRSRVALLDTTSTTNRADWC